MSQDQRPDPLLTPGQQALAAELARQGSASGEYTAEEKLALVASELMAPEEVGLASAEEARLQIMPDAEKKATLGDAVKFEAGIVPLSVRAEWARQELKIIPTDISAWKEKWMEDNKNTFRIQGYMHCGTALAKFERTYADPILGLAMMLRLAGDMLEAKYTEAEIPPATDNVAPESNETPALEA